MYEVRKWEVKITPVKTILAFGSLSFFLLVSKTLCSTSISTPLSSALQSSKLTRQCKEGRTNPSTRIDFSAAYRARGTKYRRHEHKDGLLCPTLWAVGCGQDHQQSSTLKWYKVLVGPGRGFLPLSTSVHALVHFRPGQSHTPPCLLLLPGLVLGPTKYFVPSLHPCKLAELFGPMSMSQSSPVLYW